MIDVPEREFSSITKIEISNFESFQNDVVLKDIQDANNLIGLYDTVKKDIFAAIYFALGATATDLRVTHLAELKNNPDATMYVQLEIKAPGIAGNQIVRRELREPGNVELLFDNLEFNQPLTMDEYLGFLKTLKFDFQKQFYFYDAYNRDIVWNKFTCEQDELIAMLTDSTKEIRRLHQLLPTQIKLEKIGYRFLEVIKYSRTIDSTYKKLLPDDRFAWPNSYAAFVTSHFKRQEEERIYLKAKLQTVVAKLAAVDANILNFQQIIDAETVARDAKAQRNQELLEIRRKNWDEILKCTRQPVGLPDTATVLSMNIESLHLRNLMQKTRILIENNKTLIKDLERYKIAAENNITFMGDATGTRRKSNMITEDALLKIYPIYHGSDQCKMDLLELKYLEKQEALNSIEHKIENFQYFKKILPLQRFKQVDDDEICDKMKTELKDTIRRIVHPNAYLWSFDEMKLDVLSSMIPSHQGFVLCKALTAANKEHMNLVRNILRDHKYTVVVYKKSHIKVVYKTIEKSLPEWCKNVTFLALNDLPHSRTEFIPPLNHWLNYCNYTSKPGDNRATRKLIHHLGKQKLNIICVESHEAVREEFKRKSKKYVASIDGQLIYTRSMTGIDILMYFAPGSEEVKHMYFPDACDRLRDAHSKFGEWMSSTFAKTEVVPQPINVDLNQTNNLRAEVDRLKTDFFLKKDQQINQMEAFRDRMNRPYDVSDIQNYDQALVVEQGRLNAMNARIIELQHGISDFERIERNQLQEQALWTDHIKYLTEFDKNEIEIDQHNEAIKASEEQRNKCDECIVQLQIESDELNVGVKNLKYRTIRTVMLASREGINWANIDCNTSPPNLFQAIANGEFIDPHQISTHFDDLTDTFDRDIFIGKREWYDRIQRVEREAVGIQRQLGVTFKGMLNERDTISTELKNKQISLNNEMNEILESIAQASYPNMTIEYEFQLKDTSPCVAAQMITYWVNGCRVRFEDLTHTDQVLVHWIGFAALHHYSRAPFVFIDLSNVPENVIQMISPLVEKMSKNAQLFINSSNLFHIKFAELQFAPNVKRSANSEHTIQVVRHDSSKHVLPPDDSHSHGGPGDRDGEREPNEADRIDGDGRD